MKLLIDVGHSRIKYAPLEGDHLGRIVAFAYSANDILDALDEHWSLIEAPEAIYIASVRSGAINDSVVDWIRARWQVVPFFVCAQETFLGLTNAYKDPQCLGVDRWLAMLAAWVNIKSSVIIVDCGSAMTLDCVDGLGRHLGGWIVPGEQRLIQLFQQSFDKVPVPQDALANYQSSFGTNTLEAVSKGCSNMLVATILRFKALAAQHVEAPKVYLTGGSAKELYLHIDDDAIILDPSLVIKGLAITARHQE